jgi:opacity protein-like surface antigen
MKKVLVAAALALLPLPLAAQSRIAVGVGPGVTQTDDLSGSGMHAQVSAHLLEVFPGVSLRGEALYQQGTASGSPLDCQLARQQYCTGRSDENRLMGAGVYSRLDLATNGRVTAYLTPIGVGVYHRRTRSSEWEAPTAICIDQGQMVSCPNNPDWTQFTGTTSRLSLGWSSGGGVEMAVGRGRVFLEARAHDLLEHEGMAGALPLTIGVSF